MIVRSLLILVALGLVCSTAAQESPPADPAGAAGAAAADPGGTPEESSGDPTADAAGRALSDALDREISRLDTRRRELETLLDRATAMAGEERSRHEDALRAAARLAGASRISTPGSTDADTLYDRIVAQLKAARRDLSDALDGRGIAPPTPDPPLPASQLADLDAQHLDPEDAARVRRVTELDAEVVRLRTRFLARRAESRRTAVRLRGEIVTLLNRSRIEALDRLSRGKRRSVLGVAREGTAQLRREIDQLRLAFRLYVTTRLWDLRSAPNQLRDVFRMGGVTLAAIRTLLVLGLAVWTGRRARSWIERGRLAMRRRLRTRGALRWNDGISTTLRAVAPWSVFLASLAALPWALGPGAMRLAEVRLILRIAALYGIYRLGIDALFATSLGLARRYRLKLASGDNSRLLHSVRSILRVVVGVLLLLAVSGELVGRGYLYHVILRVSWILGALLVLRIVNSWRPAIADAYLSFRPAGWLARAVRASRDRWYGVFVVAASFAVLAARAIAVVGGDFLMGFEQTRRALAYLVRRRMEKHAEREGYADGEIEALPESLRAAFTEDPLGSQASCIDSFPGLEDTHRLIDEWAASEDGTKAASVLVVGERGAGKTSWLARLQPEHLPIDHLTLDGHVRTESDLGDRVSSQLGLEVEGSGLRTARRGLMEGPRRVVTIDRVHNLFLAMVGGYQVFEEFVEFMEQTSSRVFWVCAGDSFAWDRLLAARPELAVFTRLVRLEPWTEEQIAELIRSRTAAADVHLLFDDVLADRVARDLDAKLEAEQAFHRLLWDYSDGNPLAAVHFWLRSLVPEADRRLRVRLFRRPDPAVLQDVSDDGKFLLAAILSHENLSLREASLVTRNAAGQCHVRLGSLQRLGVLYRHEGRYRVTTHWQREVVRFLRRRNLLSA